MIENTKTRAPAESPPKNAKMEIGLKNLNENNTVDEKYPDKIAPKVAPEEIPKIPESANGFLKKPWNTAPLPPSNAPHKMHKRIRGKRISKRMIFSNRFISPLNKTDGEIFSAPKKSDRKTVPMKISMRIRKNIGVSDDSFFLFIQY